MSSDSELERLLRGGRDALPEPDASATRRARARALAAAGGTRRRRAGPAVIGVAIALLVGSGIGFSFGSSVTPSGNAAGSVLGLGFLPERGWDVLQTGAQATHDRPAVAIASNRAFAPVDAARGARDSSGLPYATLLALPPRGIVIVARLTRSEHRYDPSSLYPPRRLPLRLRDALPATAFGIQVRPERPLGQYLLRASVNRHDVELQIYFGARRPSPALVEAAQRQVDRLVVNTSERSASAHARAFPLRPTSVRATAASRTLDLTLVCATALAGAGQHYLGARGHRGTGRARSGWDRPALAAVTSGTTVSGGTQNPTVLDNWLAWVTAGKPSASATLVEEHLPIINDLYRTRVWGTVAINGRRCRSTKARVALDTRGLQARALGPFDDNVTCPTPRRVDLRIRAVLARPGVLRSYRAFARTTIPVREGRLAVQTESGRRLAYAEVFQSGNARLFVARGCSPR